MHSSELWREMRSPQEMAGLNADAAVLLAYSGGADSTALLYCLLEQRRQHPFPLILAHVNHGIRGEEALRDRDFCVAVAKREGLEICVLNADVPSLAAESRRSLEEQARLVRYEYFERLMREKNVPILVTAHHANDQLETVLFRLSRGTGLHGLCGIPAVRAFANGTLVRPLLPFSRERIETFCREKQLAFVSDSTNTELCYARNRLRHELVPILEEMFSGCAERVGATVQALGEDDAYLFSIAHAFLEEHAVSDGLPVKDLCTQEAPVCKRVLMLWGEEHDVSLESVHLSELMRLCREGSSDARVALPGSVYATLVNGNLVLTKERMAKSISYCVPFAEGEYTAGDTGIVISVARQSGGESEAADAESVLSVSLSERSVCQNVFWRQRRPGDTLLLRGMHRKIRRLYAEAGYSQALREQVPLLCDEYGVLWAPGIGCRDGVIANRTQEGYTLKILLPQGLK